MTEKIGSLHLHIDGGMDRQRIEEIVDQLRDFPTTFHLIDAHLPGKQRKELLSVYQEHTPTSQGEETFSFFSTTKLPDRETAEVASRYVLESLSQISGMAVEVEQVVATLDESGWQEVGTEEEVVACAGFPSTQGVLYEVHHGIDLPPGSISLLDFRNLCELAGLTMGGVFLFHDAHGAAQKFRTNAFFTTRERSRVEGEHALLQKLFFDRKICRRKVLIEKSLGLWNF